MSNELNKLEQQQQILNRAINRLPTSLLSLALIFVAMGNFTDSIALVTDIATSIQRQFSNDVEYQEIAAVRPGINTRYIEDTLGQAKVLKPINDKLTAMYYFSDKYLLTLFVEEDRIRAFYVISLQDDFTPDIPILGEVTLGEITLGKLFPFTDNYSYDQSRNIAYFMEANEINRNGFALHSYLGWTSYGANFSDSPLTQLDKLYNAEVRGGDTDNAMSELRNKLSPNLYGFGELPIDTLFKGLMTAAEVSFYQ